MSLIHLPCDIILRIDDFFPIAHQNWKASQQNWEAWVMICKYINKCIEPRPETLIKKMKLLMKNIENICGIVFDGNLHLQSLLLKKDMISKIKTVFEKNKNRQPSFQKVLSNCMLTDVEYQILCLRKQTMNPQANYEQWAMRRHKQRRCFFIMKANILFLHLFTKHFFQECSVHDAIGTVLSTLCSEEPCYLCLFDNKTIDNNSESTFPKDLLFLTLDNSSDSESDLETFNLFDSNTLNALRDVLYRNKYEFNQLRLKSVHSALKGEQSRKNQHTSKRYLMLSYFKMNVHTWLIERDIHTIFHEASSIHLENLLYLLHQEPTCRHWFKDILSKDQRYSLVTILLQNTSAFQNVCYDDVFKKTKMDEALRNSWTYTDIITNYSKRHAMLDMNSTGYEEIMTMERTNQYYRYENVWSFIFEEFHDDCHLMTQLIQLCPHYLKNVKETYGSNQGFIKIILERIVKEHDNGKCGYSSMCHHRLLTVLKFTNETLLDKDVMNYISIDFCRNNMHLYNL